MGYCMELFNAAPHRVGSAWSFLSAIVFVVAGVKRLPPKPRAVVDAGVVTGLSVGIMSLFYHYLNLKLMGVLPPTEEALGTSDDPTVTRISYCPVTFLARCISGVVSIPLDLALVEPAQKAEDGPVAPPSPFMAGKSLVASVQDAKGAPSVLWALCPIHWSYTTMSQVGVGMVLFASLLQFRKNDRVCSRFG